MELVKKESSDLDLQRGRGLFLELLDRHERIPLCVVKVEVSTRFGLVLSDDQLLQIANGLLTQGEMKILKFVSRGHGFFDTVICRNRRNRSERTVGESVKTSELDWIKVIILDLARERRSKGSEIIELTLDLISDRDLVAAVIDSLEKEGRLLTDPETGFMYNTLE